MDLIAKPTRKMEKVNADDVITRAGNRYTRQEWDSMQEMFDEQAHLDAQSANSQEDIQSELKSRAKSLNMPVKVIGWIERGQVASIEDLEAKGVQFSSTEKRTAVKELIAWYNEAMSQSFYF